MSADSELARGLQTLLDHGELITDGSFGDTFGGITFTCSLNPVRQTVSDGVSDSHLLCMSVNINVLCD